MSQLLLNQIICGNSEQELKKIPDDCVDLTVTSPPYDDLRNYDGYSFDFENIARELFRITKQGGVVVWVVGDSTIKGSESGTSFKQALYFKKIGFNLHDTMIYMKTARFQQKNRYAQTFDYMFVLSKGRPSVFNSINDHLNKPDSHKGNTLTNAPRQIKTGVSVGSRIRAVPRKFSQRWNIWYYPTGYLNTTKDKIAYTHPAIFPEQLAQDHILSWSNEGDLILDPFAGSGTTLKMAKLNKRNYLGIEISSKYCDIINERLTKGAGSS